MTKNHEIILGTTVLAAGTVLLIYKAANRKRNKRKAGFAAGGVLAAGGAGVLAHSLLRTKQTGLPAAGSRSIDLLAERRSGSPPAVKAEKQTPEKTKKLKRGIKIALRLIRENPAFSDAVKNAMNENLIKGLYAAEKKRMMLIEKISAALKIRRFDGDTIGYAQISGKAFEDVIEYYKDDLAEYCKETGLPPDITLETGFGNYLFEDFAATYYLAHCVKSADIDGCSAEDIVKFGILFYHCGRGTIKGIQDNILAPAGKNAYLYANMKDELLKMGRRDIIDYVEEICNFSDIKK